jgi:hypothetical protein
MDSLAGRLPAETDTATLQMSEYLNLLDAAGGEEPPRRWGLRPDGRFGDVVVPADELGQPERYQDCVPVAMAYLAQAWTAGDREPYVPDRERALGIYERVSPFTQAPATSISPGSRSDPNNDYGASLLFALTRWVKQAQPLSGLLPPAAAFMEVEPQNVDQIREAVWRFGGVLVGLALPEFVLDEKGSPKDVWYVPGYGPIGNATPGGLSSHCVAITGYDRRGFLCRTAGKVRRLTDLFVGRAGYVEECYTVLSPAALGRYPGLSDQIATDLNRSGKTQAFPRRWRGSHIM